MEEYLEAIRGIEAAHAKDLEEINHYVFTHPELGMEEKLSSAYLANYMRAEGFRVQMPFGGFDTAFLAEYGEGRPQIDFLAEYDALPGYGEDSHNGHACGHNWIASTTAGAALTVKGLIEKGLVKGKVRLVGTPAEETYCTKVQMAADGVFADTDTAIQTHLSEETGVCSCALAMNTLVFEYHGKAAHAAAAPWDGVNALDAVQLLYAGINALRQHVRPDIRIHGIIREGGQAANIVPDKASCIFYVRSATREYLNTVLEKVYRVAQGAAMMTGATLEIKHPELPMDNLVHIPTLQSLAEKYLVSEGMPPTLTPEHASEIAGSTDVGNVSYACPTMYIEAALDSPSPVMCHEASALELVDSPYAYDALHKMVRVMAAMAAELMTKPELVKKAHEDLKKNRHCM